VPALSAALAGDPSPAVREAAAKALAAIKSMSVLSALRQAARLDTDSLVRHTARLALEIIEPSSQTFFKDDCQETARFHPRPPAAYSGIGFKF
jgi:HEAT repeat protein